MSRFDQREGEPYGVCENCDVQPATKAECHEHLHSTFKDGHGHRVRITNPTRAERISRELDQLADEALDDFLEGADRLIYDGEATQEEVTEAMRSVVLDAADGWDDYVKETRS